tara:strand:+ start:101 stop:673 length:573 start_codon:yes stop_codon:yes gene_type:complete
MANEIYDSTWWGNTIQTAASIGKTTEMIQGQFNLTKIGDELVTNGDFSDGLNGWSVVGGSYASVNNGILNSNNTSNGSWHSQYIGQELSFVNGEKYIIKFRAKNVNGNLNLRLTQQAFVIFNQNITSEFVDYSIYYTSQHDGFQLRFFCNDNVGQFDIDNVSVKQARATTVEAVKCLADAIHTIGLQNLK